MFRIKNDESKKKFTPKKPDQTAQQQKLKISTQEKKMRPTVTYYIWQNQISNSVLQ